MLALSSELEAAAERRRAAAQSAAVLASVVNVVAGTVGSMIGDTVVFPIDTVKARVREG